MKHITVVLGTARDGRESEKVAKAVVQAFQTQEGAEVVFVDVKDHVKTPTTRRRKDTNTDAYKAWEEIVRASDVFVFVLPEYHRGYPGEWKLLIDSLEEAYRDKHAYIVGVSSGMFAGVRMGEHIKPVLVELGFILHRTGFYVGNVETAFDPEGSFIEASSQKRLEAFVLDVLKKV